MQPRDYDGQCPRNFVIRLAACFLLAGISALAGACSSDPGSGLSPSPDGAAPVTPGQQGGDSSDAEQVINPGQDGGANVRQDATAPDATALPPAGSLGWRNGLALVSEGSVVLSGPEVTVSLELSKAANVVSQEELISFIQNHRALFTDQQYLALTGHQYFTERGYAADLLLGVLGVVFGGDFDYYRNNTSSPMKAANANQQQFLSELSKLHEHPYTMKGNGTAVSQTSIPSSPRFYAELMRVTFADGATLSAVNTHLVVTDQNNGSRLTASPNAPPLELFSSDHFAPALDVRQEHGDVAAGTTDVEKGQQMDVTVSKAVQCVSHQQLVAFVEGHKSLFGSAEHAAITGAAFFADVSRTPELLLAILGTKLGGGLTYFDGAAALEIAAYDQGDNDLFAALAGLKNENHTLTGTHTVIGTGMFGAVPHVFVPVVRVYLPDGSMLRIISTRAIAADGKGSTDDVKSQSGAPALTLTPG